MLLSLKIKRHALPAVLVLLLLFSLSTVISGCSFTGLPQSGAGGITTPQATATGTPSSQATTLPSPNATPTQDDSSWQIPAEHQATVKVVEKLAPSVVTVVNTLDPKQGFAGEARGSGVIIDSDGHIVTNDHVVEGAASNGLQVIFYDGTTTQATVVGTDSLSDLAVLKVDPPVPGYAEFDVSGDLKVGETVIAIGSALGDFENTVTVGVVSGVNRSLQRDDGTNMENMIQTDAAINHGNSGGPLLNLSGLVVGINTAIVRSTGDSTAGDDVAEGLGFAIPADTVRTVAAQLLKDGKVVHPYLGVGTEPVSRALSSYYNLRDEKGNLLESGVMVDSVVPGSAADKAGLQEGDVILSVNDIVVDANHPLINVLTNFQPGDTVTLKVLTNGKTRQLKVTLDARP